MQEEHDIGASLMEQITNATRQQQEHVAINVEKEVAASLTNILQQDDCDSITRIPRVPERLRKGANGAYDPSAVSIGPYHWGKPLFEDMEKFKRRVLQNFLDRPLNREYHCLQDYVTAIQLLEPRLKSCYDVADIDKMRSQEFLQMMLVDGCFVVEVHLQLLDPVSSVGEVDKHVYIVVKNIDMLLLENQLPFFLLQRIYEIFVAADAAQSYPSRFIELAFKFRLENFPPEFSIIPATAQLELPQTVLHLLHLEHWIINYYCSRQQPIIQTPSSKSPRSVFMRVFGLILFKFFGSSEINPLSYLTIPSATELHDLGVKFKALESPVGSLLAKFDVDHGVLKISPLFFTNMAVTRLHNLIALERLYFRTVPPCFMAFYKLIDLLVNTSSDVALLRKYEIIHHQMGSDEEVALLLNQLNKGMILDDIRSLEETYCILYRNVNDYRKVKWHCWRASFMRDYCSSPWKTLAWVVGFILLALTFVQSYMSLHSYFLPPN